MSISTNLLLPSTLPRAYSVLRKLLGNIQQSYAIVEELPHVDHARYGSLRFAWIYCRALACCLAHRIHSSSATTSPTLQSLHNDCLLPLLESIQHVTHPALEAAEGNNSGITARYDAIWGDFVTEPARFRLR